VLSWTHKQHKVLQSRGYIILSANFRGAYTNMHFIVSWNNIYLALSYPKRPSSKCCVLNLDKLNDKNDVPYKRVRQINLHATYLYFNYRCSATFNFQKKTKQNSQKCHLTSMIWSGSCISPTWCTLVNI